MMQTVTREQALAGTLALVNPAHPLQARPAPEALVPAMPDAPGVLLARQAAVMLAALLDGIRAAGRIVPVSGWRCMRIPCGTTALNSHRNMWRCPAAASMKQALPLMWARRGR